VTTSKFSVAGIVAPVTGSISDAVLKKFGYIIVLKGTAVFVNFKLCRYLKLKRRRRLAEVGCPDNIV
jgi:hypothetical protein